jgi:hypothetical protein
VDLSNTCGALEKGGLSLGKFTKKLLQSRIEAFQSFVEQLGWDLGAQPRADKGVLSFFVTDGKTSIWVEFTPQGGIHIWGKPGPLKTRLVEWISQEQPGYADHSASWLSLRPKSSVRSETYDMLIAQIQKTAYGLVLTDVNGVRVGLVAQDVLELVDWVAERRGDFEQMALHLNAVK